MTWSTSYHFKNIVKVLFVILCLIAIAFWNAQTAYALSVFPGAIGYGTDTVAGRGGEIYKVTSLNANEWVETTADANSIVDATSDHYSGNYAARIWKNANLKQFASLTPGKQYRLTFAAKGPLRIYLVNSSVIWSLQSVGAGETWGTFTRDFTAVAYSADLRFYGSAASNWSYVDDVSLKELVGGETVGEEIFANTGFETFSGTADDGTQDDFTSDGTITACINASGPRICVFEISGIITVGNPGGLIITNPYITIAGQTSPSPGIMLKGFLSIQTHDVLIQHITVRPGLLLNNGSETDAITIEDYGDQNDVYNVVLDHVSASWANDEVVSTWYTNVHDVTISNSIIGPSLDDNTHTKGIHGYGLLIGNYNTNIAILNNLLVHNTQRNPLLALGTSTLVVNNLVYNAGIWSHIDTNGIKASFIGNSYKSGSDSGHLEPIYFYNALANSSAYVIDNVWDGVLPSDPWSIVRILPAGTAIQVYSSPVSLGNVSPLAGSSVEQSVLSNAGSRPADRDSVDTEVIQDVQNETGAWIDCVTSDTIYYPSGTAQGGTINTITLATTASDYDDKFNGRTIEITGGTGSGQSRVISDYVGASRLATVSVNWDTTPDSSSTYQIANDCSNNAGGWPTLTQNTRALSLPDNPSNDDDADGYTNIEELLHTYAYSVEGKTLALSEISAATHTESATIQWTTDIDGSSQVEYGDTASYGKTTSETDTSPRKNSHSVAISNFNPCATYHYRIKSTDALGNTTQSNDLTFATPGCPSAASNPAPSCTDSPPGNKAPWLYGAISQDASSVLLYFTNADDPVNKYVLEYGAESGNYQYSVQDMGLDSKTLMTFLVKSLFPDTTYYFRVRGGNGCATGPWSNEISAKTQGPIPSNQLEIVNLELKAKPKESPGTEEQEGYSLKVKVLDRDGNPVVGAKVSIYSKVQEAVTNEEGIAEFKNVESGEHRVLISYDNYQGEQTVNLSGDVKEFDLNFTVRQKAISLPLLNYGIIGLMVAIIVVMAILLINTRSKKY